MFLQGWRASAAIFILAFGWIAHGAAWAQDYRVEHPDLAKALAYFERGDYQRSAAELTTLLDENELSPHERNQALEALGISHYVLGRMLDARQSFTLLLEDDPGYRPDPLYVPPEIVAFVLDIKRNLAAAQPSEGPPPQRREEPVAEEPRPVPEELQARPMPPVAEFSLIDLAPFGAGQFRRGWHGRGATLAALQTVFLGSNIGLYYYRHCGLKESCSAEYYPEENLSRARNLHTLQIVGGSLFIATAALGVLDALQLPLKSGGVTVQPMSSGVGITVPLD